MKRALFVGRSGEMVRLTEGFATVVAKGVGCLTLITGEAGIGKTRLLAEFRDGVGGEALCLIGRGSPLSRTIPFAVLVEACESHLRTLQPAKIDALAGRRAADLAAVFPSFAVSSRAPAEPARLRTIEAILYLLSALGADRPLLLCLDDLHEADPSTWEVLYYFGRNPPQAPVFVAAAARSEGLAASPEQAELVAALLKDGLAGEVRLRPLQSPDVARMARLALGNERSTDALVAWLVERSGGNPLFAQALLQEPSSDQQPVGVPPGVKERVAALVRAQPETARDILALAAALGHPFSPGTMSLLSQSGDESRLDDLVRAGFLVERTEGVLTTYDFRHPLIREAVYENIGAARRRQLHRAAATRLDGEPLAVRAYHAARGALPGDVDALALIRQAAHEAERAQSSREAIAHLHAAMQLIPASSVGERREVLDELAWQASLASDFATGISALDELEPMLADDPAALGTLFLRRASFLSTNLAELEAADREIGRAIELFEAHGITDRVAASLNELAWVRGEAGDLAAQIETSRSALALAESHGNDTVRLHALGSLGHSLSMAGRFEEAEPVVLLAQELSLSSGDRTQVGWHTGMVGDFYCTRGEFVRANAVFDAFLEQGPSVSEVAYIHRARAQWFAGRWTDAIESCRQTLAMSPGAPSSHAAWTLSLAGLLEVEIDRPESARSLLAQGDRAYGDRDFYWFASMHRWASGRAHFLMGDWSEARRRFERAYHQLRHMGADGLVPQVASDLVELFVEEGELTAAGEVAAELDKCAARMGTDFAKAQASSATGMLRLASNDRAGASARFEAAAVAFEACGAPFLEGRCREYFAAAVDGPAAIEALNRAAKLYAGLPAPIEERRVLATLRRLGPRGRRARQSIGDLTPREREVLALTRRGMSTRAIAERLFLGERTIETHLAHIYAKLGVSGRAELLRDADGT